MNKKKSLFLLKKIEFTSFLVFLLIFNISMAQEDYSIRLQNERIDLPENIETFQWNQMPNSAILNNGYIGWIQFYETPSQSIQDNFKKNNLELLEYIPNKTYLFYFPNSTSISFLKEAGVRSITPVNGDFKLESNLKKGFIGSWAMEGNSILVTLQYHKYVSSEFVIKDLASKQISVKHEYKGSNIIDLAIPNNCLEVLSNLPYVKWIEVIDAPAIIDDTRGKSSQRSNNLDTQMPSGRNYTGKGIGVMVRDFGPIDSHIDFQGRLVNYPGTLENLNHGDLVGGILAGAGNLNPSMRGMAAGSDIYNTDQTQHFLDPETTNLIYDGTVQITNTSSGLLCQNGYTLNAVTLDRQTKEIPTLLHVLSASNSNGFDCGYGAGNQWGNLGGANKTGKNMIAAANVTYNGIIVSTSSRGPAADGRIKPDISAMGNGQYSTDENNRYYQFGGTSAAAPGIAGVSAQLYEAYGTLNHGALPQSALIKAAMLNTTNEAGNIGPDYIYGWGIVNGFRAAKLIEDGRYLLDDISQGETNTHSINIPSGTTQVRFMAYWSDVPGAVGANPALVNDLDLVVKDPANNNLLPWVLDHTPDPIALNTPATNGLDHLNNMEQVLINNPAAGDYTLDITGFNVPMGPQEYFIVYEVISDNVTVTYPNGGEKWVIGSSEVIHWDAINTTADFDLEYSIDEGVNWTNIATVPPNTTTYIWSVPSNVTGSALIKVTSGSFTDTSNAVFSSTEQVNNFSFSIVCPDEATFVWDPLANAESYDIYLLGEKYMEIVGNSTTASFSTPIADVTATIWAAIVAKNDTENWTSLRTIAISNTGELNCTIVDDLKVLEILNDGEDFSSLCSGITDVIVSAEILNFGTNPQSNFEVSYQLSGQPIVTELFNETITPGEQVIYNFATPLSVTNSGPYTLTVSSNLTGDDNPGNNAAILDFFAITETTSLDFEEDFETNGVPPDGWLITNVDDYLTWTQKNGIIGSDGNTTVAAFVNNYVYDDTGEEDFLTTEAFDLTTLTVASLSFDLAKAQFSANTPDALRVEIATNCDGNFTTIYEKSGLDLSTVPDYQSGNWDPTSGADWRTEQIDLTDYIGEYVQLRFVNITGYGNATFIDNIQLTQTLGIKENSLSEITLYPNPATGEVFIKLTAEIAKDASIIIVNNLGQVVQKISNQELGGNTTARINLSEVSTGIYFITITSQGVSETKKLIIN